jgi:hypothetical protein
MSINDDDITTSAPADGGADEGKHTETGADGHAHEVGDGGADGAADAGDGGADGGADDGAAGGDGGADGGSDS